MQPLTWDETKREALLKEIGERFDSQGYVIIRQFFDQALIERVKLVCSEKVDALADKLKANGVVGDAMEREPFDKRLYQLFKDRMDLAPKSFDHTLHVAELYDLFFNRKLLDVMACFLGEELRLYPNYTVRPKFPLWEGTHVLWHQDGGYTKRKSQHVESGTEVDTFRMINVWAPLVPATKQNGCMQFIPGSHKLGVVEHVDKEPYIEIAASVLEPLLKDAVDIEVDPGDIVLFNNLMFHYGQPNTSDRIRWSVDWRYQDATQPTNRWTRGHIARSRLDPFAVVQSPTEWEKLCSWH